MNNLFLPVELRKETNYWLIRTEGGTYFEEFIREGYVAIGWDSFNNVKEFLSTPPDKMKEIIAEKQEVTRAGYIYGQIKRFIQEISVGDIIIIPSKSSKKISIGVVESDVYIENELNYDDKKSCPFKKRRRINWAGSFRNREIDPYLYRLLMARNTISYANKYAKYIDRMIFNFFIKEDKVHLVLRVSKEEKVLANQLLNLINETIDFARLYNEHNYINKEDSDPNNVEIKLNVQSPGPIELIATGTAVLVIGYLLYRCIGGKFEIPKLGISGSGKEGITRQEQVISEVEEQISSNRVLKEELKKKQSEIEELYTRLGVEVFDKKNNKKT